MHEQIFYYFVCQKVIHRQENVRYVILHNVFAQLDSLFDILWTNSYKTPIKEVQMNLFGIWEDSVAYKVTTKITDKERMRIHYI